jgi:single-strand DNA-binding protein
MSLNKVMLIGHLGHDVELRRTSEGKAVTTLRIATNGNRDSKPDWHRVVVWEKQAESCKEFLKKGRQVYVEGRLQTRDFADAEGNTRRVTEVVAQRVQFLGVPASQTQEPLPLEEETVSSG